MIANITKGEDFGGIFRYLLKENKDAEIIGGNVGGQTPQELETEFEMFSSLNPKVQKTVTHFSLAFAPEDGEIDRETKVRIADRIITEMGYSYAQHLIVSHGRNDPGHDEEHNHDHLHIVANSVDLSGRWVDDFQNYPRLEKILRRIEQAENLRQVESSWCVKHNAPTHGQKQRHKRELREVAEGVRDIATAPVSDRLQLAIDRAAAENQTVGDFAVQLARAGITCKLKITRTGKVQGISYQMEGVSFQGNQLYDASLPKLQSVYSLNFDFVRDGQKIEMAAERLPQLEAPAQILETPAILPPLQEVKMPSHERNIANSDRVVRSRQRDRGR
jgi:Relaxase/Mobilisation nuclease domain